MSYPERVIAEELLEGFTNGFRLNYKGPRMHCMAPNLISAVQNRTETLKKIQNEISFGRILGPFNCLPISTLRVSPIGLVPKPDGKWRLITHLSYPHDCSINSFIDPELCKVSYCSFDKILDKIYECGKGALMAKVDIKSAFRLLIVNPADFDLLGIYFEGQFYIDKCLPMGCAISCSLFEKFATFLHWAVEKASGTSMLDHYLDDFFFVGQEGTENCLNLMNNFQNLCRDLGVPIAENKTTGPTTVIEFLGLLIDTVLMMVRIPYDKLQKLQGLLKYMLNRRKVFMKELESLVGLLAFCSRAIPSSRAFLRRFYDLIASVKIKRPYYMVRINKETKADILMWIEFLDRFNGQFFFPEREWLTNEVLQLFTDSSGNADLGCGAYFNGHWAQFRWPTEWRNNSLLRNLTFLELVPVVLALFLWGSSLRNKKILFNIDNMALVSVINKRTSKDKMVMKLLRPLVLVTMLNNVQFKGVHLSSCDNAIADAISRFQLQRFQVLAPQADPYPEPIPTEFLEVISGLF